MKNILLTIALLISSSAFAGGSSVAGALKPNYIFACQSEDPKIVVNVVKYESRPQTVIEVKYYNEAGEIATQVTEAAAKISSAAVGGSLAYRSLNFIISGNFTTTPIFQNGNALHNATLMNVTDGSSVELLCE